MALTLLLEREAERLQITRPVPICWQFTDTKLWVSIEVSLQQASTERKPVYKCKRQATEQVEHQGF